MEGVLEMPGCLHAVATLGVGLVVAEQEFVRGLRIKVVCAERSMTAPQSIHQSVRRAKAFRCQRPTTRCYETRVAATHGALIPLAPGCGRKSEPGYRREPLQNTPRIHPSNGRRGARPY